MSFVVFLACLLFYFRLTSLPSSSSDFFLGVLVLSCFFHVVYWCRLLVSHVVGPIYDSLYAGTKSDLRRSFSMPRLLVFFPHWKTEKKLQLTICVCKWLLPPISRRYRFEINTVPKRLNPLSVVRPSGYPPTSGNSRELSYCACAIN